MGMINTNAMVRFLSWSSLSLSSSSKAPWYLERMRHQNIDVSGSIMIYTHKAPAYTSSESPTLKCFILLVRRLEYSELNRPIPWLLMTWMPSYQYWDLYHEDKKVPCPSYLHNEIPVPEKTLFVWKWDAGSMYHQVISIVHVGKPYIFHNGGFQLPAPSQ